MRHMLSCALVAGLAAGLLCALLQYLLVEPDILLAERYESGELVYFQAVAGQGDHAAPTMQGMDTGVSQTAAHDHDHGHDAGAEDGQSPWQRHGLTVLFAVLTYCGYGLLLIAGIQLAEAVGLTIGRSEALLWGLAGFLAFQMMPALGLEPAVPGTPEADLTARQLWWVATAAATVIGLWFLAYGTALWQRAAGIVLLAAPHVWGAPKPEAYGGVVPPELAAAFTAHSLGVGLVTWLVLGAVTVALWQSEHSR